MCLAVPMRVVEIRGLAARCEARGVERTVSLLLLHDEPLAPGDYLMVHSGRATATMTEVEAQAAWALFDEILGAGQPPEACV
jgi:hydrogenase expression/formation protein HypC